MPDLNHGCVSVLLDVPYNFDGHIVLVLAVPAFKHSAKGPCKHVIVSAHLRKALIGSHSIIHANKYSRKKTLSM